MRNRLTKILTGLAALAALALGGAALATAGHGGSQPSKPAAAVQQGPAKSSDTVEPVGLVKDSAQTNIDSPRSEGPNDPAGDQAEGKDDQAGDQAESGSEVRGDDGPGGHADEPGNPNADHQFEGQE
jgi:hypothetical protein